MDFSNLGLSTDLLRAVTDAGYTTPTAIQAEAIPEVLKGRDILGIAQTGTGKTASFTLPMIDLLAQGRAKARMPRTLILEPTRELAMQVSENFEVYGKYHKLSMALLIGGVSFNDQAKLIDRGVDVLIATPGRLLDHFGRGKLMLHGVEILVIDEADRMLDMGFIPDIEKICKLLPPSRQTLFFSATMPSEIQRLTQAFLNNPKRIEVASPTSAAKTVKQSLVMVDAREKRKALRALLRSEPVANAIIFCNRKRDVDMLFKSLKEHGFSVGALHGDMEQRHRLQVLEQFKANEIQILVASDVAARGLDIPKVSHVFNFDVPIHSEDYIHRIGRTGRAGREGFAFMFASPAETKYVDAIERMTGIPIPRSESAGTVPLAASDAPEEVVADTQEPPKRRRPTSRRAKTDKPVESGTVPLSEKVVEIAAEKTVEPQRAERRGPDRHVSERHSPDRHVSQPLPRDDHRRGDHGVVGMGDHVPAFILRPVPAGSLSKTASMTEGE
ncbi:MAG TPA: DEAD/DEAH box helicase [Alphaproteobacteria bacterium]|nr:DEAD/DEAH box helicase [Alphaproteobacteria bacterium]